MASPFEMLFEGVEGNIADHMRRAREQYELAEKLRAQIDQALADVDEASQRVARFGAEYSARINNARALHVEAMRMRASLNEAIRGDE